jgi:hypothetical protein
MTDTKGSYAHGTLPGLAQLFKEVNSVGDIQKEIKEALEKATPGPWIRMGARVYPRESNRYAEDEICWGNSIPNAHLFANAPTWILHQQELIEQLRTEILDQRKLFHDNAYRLAKLSEDAYIRELRDQVEQQAEENKQLKEALEFYADEYNYIPVDDYFPSIDKDRGERAKEALSSIGGKHE